MSRGITLSPKHGLNPSLLVCPLCGEETNGLALLGRINNKTRHADIEAPKYITDNKPCEKCQKLLDEGCKFLLECDDGSQNKPSRTGRYMVLKPTAMPNWPHQISFCEHTVYEKLLKQGGYEQ